MSQNPKLPDFLSTASWNLEKDAVWMATTLILRRNLARYNFPNKLIPSDAKSVVKTLKGALEKDDRLPSSSFFSQSELSNAQKEHIFEYFLCSEKQGEVSQEAALLLENSGKSLFTFNDQNHLEMRTLCTDNKWNEAWATLAHIENDLGNQLGFAFSPKFGYLTSDPASAGTGLTVQAFLHLPALIHTKQIESAMASVDPDELFFTTLSGDTNQFIGDLLIVENNYTIGMSEEAIIHSVQDAVTKCIGAEKTIRSRLKEENNPEIKDLISKSFGLLVHAYQIEVQEALDLLSLMKLGRALNIITGVKEETLNRLYLQCRRGHLLNLFPKTEDIAHKRAEYLKRELSGIALTDEL